MPATVERGQGYGRTLKTTIQVVFATDNLKLTLVILLLGSRALQGSSRPTDRNKQFDKNSVVGLAASGHGGKKTIQVFFLIRLSVGTTAGASFTNSIVIIRVIDCEHNSKNKKKKAGHLTCFFFWLPSG